MESCHRDNWRRVTPTKKPSLILSRLVCFSRGNLDNLHFHSRQVGKLSEMLQASHFLDSIDAFSRFLSYPSHTLIIRRTNQEFRRKPIQIFAGASRKQEQLLSILQIPYWKTMYVVYSEVLLVRVLSCTIVYSRFHCDVSFCMMYFSIYKPRTLNRATLIISVAPLDHDPNVQMTKKK